jgi:hypothetical protein
MDRSLGVCLALRGVPGSGKTRFAEEYGKLFGVHYTELDSPAQVAKDFNSYLQYMCLVVINEAVWTNDKAIANRMKRLITDTWAHIEPKNVNAFDAQHYMRFIVITNEEQSVPKAIDDRRYVTIKVSDQHAKDRQYFRAIETEMNHGGRERLLYMLLHEVRIPEDFSYDSFPRTEENATQIVHGMEPHERYYYDVLCDGGFGEYLSFTFEEARAPALIQWSEQELMITKSDFYAGYRELCRITGVERRKQLSKVGLKKALERFFPPELTETSQRYPTGTSPTERVFIFPTLADCRAAFQRVSPDVTFEPQHLEEDCDV